MGLLEEVTTDVASSLADEGPGVKVESGERHVYGNDFRHFSRQDTDQEVPVSKVPLSKQYGTVTRFGGIAYDVKNSINVWSSGMWVSTSTGSSAAIASAGGQVMDLDSHHLQYLVREHMIESGADDKVRKAGHDFLSNGEQLHLRWNSGVGKIYIDGAHLAHKLELGDEILINASAPPLQLFLRG